MCSCNSNKKDTVTQPFKKLRPNMSAALKWDLSSIWNFIDCMECATGAVLTGIGAYYLVPGAGSSHTALQIAGVAFVGNLAGKYLSSNYMTGMSS